MICFRLCLKNLAICNQSLVQFYYPLFSSSQYFSGILLQSILPILHLKTIFKCFIMQNLFDVTHQYSLLPGILIYELRNRFLINVYKLHNISGTRTHDSHEIIKFYKSNKFAIYSIITSL